MKKINQYQSTFVYLSQLKQLFLYEKKRSFFLLTTFSDEPNIRTLT